MTPVGAIQIGITEHLEGPADASSESLFDTSADLISLADKLGVRYAWFAEHHAHVHRGHLPAPLLFAIHLAAKTRRINVGTAVICLNHHRTIDVAEQVATADLLTGGRIAAGFGSGSTPAEAALYGVPEMSEDERHEHFDSALQAIDAWWSTDDGGAAIPATRLPRPRPGLMQRCWSAVNSVGAARIAGGRNLNVLFSHLRTPQQYASYSNAYRAAGGRGLIAANRPLIVAETEDDAFALGDVVIRKLWRRFQSEGKIAASIVEPRSLEDVCAHPLNFIVGGPASVARELARLHAEAHFDVLNIEVTWDGLPAPASEASLRLLMEDVLPRLKTHTTVTRGAVPIA